VQEKQVTNKKKYLSKPKEPEIPEVPQLDLSKLNADT